MKKLTKKTKIIIAAVLVVAAVAVPFSLIATSDKIYHGVSAAGVDLGGMSVSDAAELLSAQPFFAELPQFECEGRVFDVSAEAVSLACDAEATAKAAYETGRGGNAFARVINAVGLAFNHADLPISVAYDTAALDAVFSEHIGDLRTPTVESQFRIDGDRIYIVNGNKGIDVNAEKLKSALASAAAGDKANIKLSVEPIEPKPVSVAELRSRFCCEKKEADYKIENKRITYTESADGIDFDDAEAEKILADNVNNPGEYAVPLKIDKAERTVETIDKELFGDCIGTYTSRYNPGEVGRTKNVTLAANKINNVVLAPGDTFSYNEIVGERTAARGFAGAKVYAGGSVVDGLGGGICQVSSTLYNAVLYADLQIVTRTCHSLPVTYVPLGRDATVAYGSIDFKFKNQYDTPVKVSSSIGGGVLTVSVYGTNTSGKKVEISTERVRTIPFSTVEEPDPSIAAGTTKTKQSGSDGAVVNTYKKVTEGGRVTSNKMIHTSYYNPINKVVLVPPAAETPEETPEQTPDVFPDTPTEPEPPAEQPPADTPAEQPETEPAP